ncbi:hypothetical protein [Streptomyces sp. NPDC005303]|uniref:hypothetical protein n=1 Tax=Streptomyces sp. NPDC005303 TaxID=3155713 RepID=UPI0033ACC3A8
MDALVRRQAVAQAWPVVDQLALVVVSVVLASSVVRSAVRLEPVPLAAAWSVVQELEAWQAALALAALVVQVLPRVQLDVSEARLVVA